VQKGAFFLSSFFSLELMIRLLGLATALLVVRYMPKEEYAFYALANNFQDSLSSFCAMGVGAGLLAIGGSVVGDRRRMGEVAAAASKQRFMLLLLGGPLAIGIFGFLLLKNGCPLWQTALLLLLAVLMLSQAIGVQIADFSFALARQYNVQQVAEAGSNAIRLLLIGVLLVGGWLYAAPTQVVGLIAGGIMLWFFSIPRAKAHVEFGVEAPPEVQSRFRRMMWHAMPATLNAIFQGQIAMWLVALLGNSTTIADLGALTRLGLLLSIPSAFIAKVLTPRLAAEKNPQKLLKFWIASVILGICGGLAFYIMVILFQRPLLALLGSQYANLSEYMGLYAGYLGYIFASSTAFAIIQARGWLKNFWLMPVCVIVFQAASLLFLHVNDIAGVIMFRWVGDIGGAIVLLWLTIAGFRGKNRI
jgi:O-antigen/teichoic acid export membrane protein